MTARTTLAGLALAVTLAPRPAPAQTEVQISGLADVLFRNRGQDDATNVNFTGASNLQTLRLRLFLDAVVSDGIQVFTQGLFARYDFLLYAAYVRFEDIGGSPVSAHLGLIPTTVGTFAPRTYSDRNPLVGVPLLYNHHSVLQPGAPQGSVDELLAMRDTRSHWGLPVIYDNCWNTGAEVYGQVGAFDWSLGLLSGSVSQPTRDQQKQVPQATGRLAWYSGPGLVIGLNGYWGPYLLDDEPGITYPDGRSNRDYTNGGVGYDLYWSSRFLEVHSEAFWALWEHPQLPDLKAVSGYVEAKYKFVPRWYAAVRLGGFEPAEVRNSAGELHPWDYPVRRAEYGLGFKPTPRVTTKLVAQHNRFQGNAGLDEDHYLLQISTAF
jgi:hypothetical protein